MTNLKNEKKINIGIDERKFNDENYVLRITNKLEDIYRDIYVPPPVIIYNKGKVINKNHIILIFSLSPKLAIGTAKSLSQN